MRPYQSLARGPDVVELTRERGNRLVGFRPERFLPAEAVDGDGDAVTGQFEVARIEYLSGDALAFISPSSEKTITSACRPS